MFPNQSNNPENHSQVLEDSTPLVSPAPSAPVEGRWELSEHLHFLKGLFKFGKNWKMIEEVVGTRMCSQVRSHAQKYFIKMNKLAKDRRKQKNKNHPLTPLELEIVENFTKEDITPLTPDVLASLLVDEKKCQNNRVNNTENNGVSSMEAIKTHMNNQEFCPSSPPITALYEHQYEDRSFFSLLIENNCGLLEEGRDLTELVDFNPKTYDISNEGRERKASFTLVENQQNSEKLQHALEKMKNQMKGI